ncbi:sulfite reductase (NADPH) flavoprotein subunit alpha [Salinisphaera shabanensis T35B1]|uniref:Sulfite reductase [NADPH] flavoprotein alpha-component n=1 Tax=Salinisphaera shabanensis E1L3A TaxID=1033802 RepID=U2FNS3_9GAMM|nr:assimilatory sulfite reductase (NADPH) flavoprotein subunit [Salinisphaera shabanensis]ERJ17834.1 Sulfite reductase NADPH flavoprotein alpha-component [Salinisphaera shabanensis E1L3A]
MKATPIQEHTSPLNAQQAQQLTSLIETLTPMQVTWISGYLSGINASAATGEVAAPQQSMPAAQGDASEPLTILYGSQTGNAEDIAETLRERAEAAGLNATVYDMLDYKPKDLKKEKNVIVCVSTHGEGDPPDNAEELHAFIYGKKAPKLDGLKFSVLAFGDTSYEHFCQTGKDFDAQLEKLGGKRLTDRVDLDVDFDEAAEAWIETVVDKYKDELGGGDTGHPTVTAMPSAGGAAASAGETYSRKNPYPAEVLENVVLNGRGSDKEVHHIEMDTEESGLVWEPGDSLGIIPENDPAVVEELIAALGLSPEEQVTGIDGEVTLQHALTHQYEITTLTRPLIEKYAVQAQNESLDALLAEDQREVLAEYMHGRFIIDLVEDYPIEGITGQDFVRLLRKLPPRLYSIASSHAANPDEIHLTVAAVRYESVGRARNGVASIQLADRSEDVQLPIYIDHNKNFKLPDNNDAPIIMIGPGTGVAPFRAFMEEREEREAGGDNWLFFGAQHFLTDFYYQTDWLRWRKEGLLTRMDVAFSRDQEEKVYVQDKIRAAGKDVFDWIEHGATVYVCGDANAMAHDVHEALLELIGENANLDAEGAADYLKKLQKEKRYQRDVY